MDIGSPILHLFVRCCLGLRKQQYIIQRKYLNYLRGLELNEIKEYLINVPDNFEIPSNKKWEDHWTKCLHLRNWINCEDPDAVRFDSSGKIVRRALVASYNVNECSKCNIDIWKNNPLKFFWKKLDFLLLKTLYPFALNDVNKYRIFWEDFVIDENKIYYHYCQDLKTLWMFLIGYGKWTRYFMLLTDLTTLTLKKAYNLWMTPSALSNETVAESLNDIVCYFTHCI